MARHERARQAKMPVHTLERRENDMFRSGMAAMFAAVWSFMAAVSVVSATESGVQLKEVVVTATKTERNTQDITQSVTVITAKELHPAVLKKMK